MQSTLLGTRISLNGHVGTVKYVGPVATTPESGSASTGTVQIAERTTVPKMGSSISPAGWVYSCSLRNQNRLLSIHSYKTSGSFIRQTPHILYGVSFLDALSAKYIETLHGSQTQESVTLGSSLGAIRVEAVSLDKIREKFARLDRLREVSLEIANIVKGDPLGSIRETCPSEYAAPSA